MLRATEIGLNRLYLLLLQLLNETCISRNVWKLHISRGVKEKRLGLKIYESIAQDTFVMPKKAKSVIQCSKLIDQTYL